MYRLTFQRSPRFTSQKCDTQDCREDASISSSIGMFANVQLEIEAHCCTLVPFQNLPRASGWAASKSESAHKPRVLQQIQLSKVMSPVGLP